VFFFSVHDVFLDAILYGSFSFVHLSWTTIGSADLYALSGYVVSNSRTSTLEPKATSSSTSEQVEAREKEMQTDLDSELTLAQLQHQLPSNEPGALMFSSF
jgi:DNA integrity scanning protein DisA with diadenylate cyclase activity